MAKGRRTKLYLVATDGSKASDKAVAFSVERAQEAGARLLVVMAILAGPIGAPSSGGGGIQDRGGQVRAKAQEVVDAAVARAARAGVKASGLVLLHEPSEDVAAALVKLAEQRRVDTILVGSHGRTGIMRVLLGSTAEKVVKLSHCPVSVVR